MALDVRRDVLAQQRRIIVSRRSRMLWEDVGDAVARQRLVTPIDEHALPTGTARHATKSVQRVRRLRQ